MTTDYKTTLNLPQTKFAMRANLGQREPEMLAFWQEHRIYEKIQAQSRPLFVLHDGPPYANGHIHIGHALNKSLKDITLKSKLFSGYKTPYIPGWDCHGLPIEVNVEKKLGKAGEKVSATEFRSACREYALTQVQAQKEEFQRLGVLADWEHIYTTMDFGIEANTIRALGHCVAQGYVTRREKPVHWCFACGSALAEAEVEYQDKQSSAIDVRFSVTDISDLNERSQLGIPLDAQVSIPIWTTTPWTLPANEAVALHPELHYELLLCEKEGNKEYFIIASELKEKTLARYQIEVVTLKAKLKGSQLQGLLLAHPFLEKKVPVVLADYVTTDTGTGAVHTAPAHGLDDYLVSLTYNLPVKNPVLANGKFKEDTLFVGGQHVFKANETMLKLLEEKQQLMHHSTITHSYPHCWRHKTPLIFRATPQWFIDLDANQLREKTLKAIENSRWIPDWGKDRISGMIASRADWCISRQRAWGTPIPLFIHKQDGGLHPDTPALIESVAKLVEKEGIEAWYQLDSATLLGDAAHYYIKCADVLDVWFDSGVLHTAFFQDLQSMKLPADLYLEGSDQHRGWFQSSLLTGMMLHDAPPFKTVLTHGFTVDNEGHKMSKSLGNVVLPEKVWNSLGADILRLWVASTDYKGEIRVSNEILQRISEMYRRIRNTARFLLSNLEDFDPDKDQVDWDDMLALDRWAIDRTKSIQDEICQVYDDYQFHLVVQKIHHFCAVDMGSFYLDILKDRLYTMPVTSVGRRSAQTTMYFILSAMTRWLAPILSVTAEEIWQHTPWKNEVSIFLTTWLDGLHELTENDVLSDEDWQQIMKIREEVNQALELARNAGNIGSSLAATVTLQVKAPFYSILQKLGDELRFVFITSGATVQLNNDAENNLDSARVKIIVDACEFEKCVRCWHRQASVGKNNAHKDLCDRCIANVFGDGETRRFA